MVHVVSISQKGTKSDVNEDACLALASRGVFVVADGVGGGPSGDFASRTLVQEVETICTESGDPKEALLAAIQSANEKIFSAAQDPRLNGMASTVAAIHVCGNELQVCHVGDSRVYRLRAGELMALTEDHSKWIEKGNDQRKQVVTRALGVRESVSVEVNQYDHADGDVYFLMSDGITDQVDEGTLLDVLGNVARPVSDRLTHIVSLSEQLGGRDDKTILCVF